MKKLILIEGMTCNHCTKRVERALSELEGVTVESISVDEKNALIALEKDIDEKIIKDTIDEAGYDVISIKMV